MKTHFTVTLSIVVGMTVGAAAIQTLHAQSKPPAYVIGEIDVRDQDGYAREYLSRSAKPILDDGGGKFLSRGSNSVSFKGDPPKRIVVLRFENLEKARAAFSSPGYAEALSYGEKYAKFRIYAVEGLPQQ
jgi:uncharacterized protein (DUF1330 family)